MRGRDTSHPISLAAGRRGFTLVELLVVISILAIVTAASIPMMTTGVEQRRVREAARLVSSYISSAKARAVETGRPSGVMIQRVVNGAVMQNYSTQLVTVEVPPSYSGDLETSQATVHFPIAISGTNYGAVTLLASPTGAQDFGCQGLVRVGDLMRFGYQGRTFVITGVAQQASSSGPWSFVLQTYGTPIANAPGPPVGGGYPVTAWTISAMDQSAALPGTVSAGTAFTGPYQINRQPVKSAVPPLQLPEGTVIDLGNSGVGLPQLPSLASGGFNGINTDKVPMAGIFDSSAYWGGPYNWASPDYAAVNPFNPPVAGFNPGIYLYPNPTVLFGPTGGVNFVYYDSNPPQHLTSAMYFLVGRREGVMDVNPGINTASQGFNDPNNPPNLFDMSNMWVAVNPQGLVVTTENANASPPANPATGVVTTGTNFGIQTGGNLYDIYFAGLAAARVFAQQSVSVGGR